MEQVRLHPFLSACERLGLDSFMNRRPSLLISAKSFSNEQVLFFLCGQDYFYHPTDEKIEGILELFIGPGKPYELNVGEVAIGNFFAALNKVAVSVTTEGGWAHSYAAFSRAPGLRPGGAGNYNLFTKALNALAMSAIQIIGDVQRLLRGQNIHQATRSIQGAEVERYLAPMRTALAPYWLLDTRNLGL